MQIGKIIRKYRKEKNMTQEEMANRLGVTAPAVNKWENEISLPDISMIAPIARLLDISTDTLLSFREKLTDNEVNDYIKTLENDLQLLEYENALNNIKAVVEKYPNCYKLIYMSAMILDAWRLAKGIECDRKYDKYILDCYERAFDGDDESIRFSAADSLYGYYMRREDYESAEVYLRFFSTENPERKRKFAEIYRKTGRMNEAYKAYEELIFSLYGIIDMCMQGIYMLAINENNEQKADYIVKKQSELATVFDMGKYREISYLFDNAVRKQDVDITVNLMKEVLDSLETLGAFTNSPLFDHMSFSSVSSEFTDELKTELVRSFLEDEKFLFLEGNDSREEVLRKIT